VNQDVAKSHDLAEIGNLGRKRSIQAIKTIERLSKNLKLALHGGT
jgi:hypothetical protein